MMRREAAQYILRRNLTVLISLAVFAVASALLYQLEVLHSDVLVTTAIFFIVVLGLDLLYGCSGQLSFGHVGFFAVGAYSVAVLFAKFSIPPLIATVIGLAINCGLSYILGRVCLRLSGSYFMLGTLAFGIMAHAVITTWYTVTGGDGGLGGIPRPVIGTRLNSDLSFGALAWTCAAILFWLTYSLSRSKVGRALRAIRSDELAASCLAVDVDRLKTNVFILSACLASLGGSLFAMYNGAVHPDSFSLSVLLDLLLMMFIGGEGTIWGGLLGTVFIRILPDLSSGLHGAKILFSGILFTVIIFALPRGIAGAVEKIAARLKLHRRDVAAAPEFALPFGAIGRKEEDDTLLRLEGVAVSFGGVRAVDDVSFEVKAGQVIGLIGPNGAGKSTLMNLISGVLRAHQGRVVLGAIDLSKCRPDQIARLGVQRTFQHERLFPDLSIAENIMVGHEMGADGSWKEIAACAFGSRRSLEAELAARIEAEAWLRAFGLEAYRETPVEKVPHGLRKMIEVARACAARPVLLLLDETVAGLNDAERQSFMGVVRSLRDAGLAIVVIEHDIDFVTELSEKICVINFGRKIAEGSPAEIRKDEAVIAAYLGQ